MTDSSTEIANLLYRYAEYIDEGDLEAATLLFAEAKVDLRGHDGLQDRQAVLTMLRSLVKIYPCGTPRTKHLVTNPIIEIDEAGGTASSRSYYTVLQSTEELPLQVIASGRYHDTFIRDDGQWRFAYRNLTLFDLKGDIGGHLRIG